MKAHDSGLAPFRDVPVIEPEMLETRACPVCGYDDRGEVLQTLPDVQFYADDRAPRVTLTDIQCAVCWAIYKNPTYTALGMRVLFAQAGASYGSEHPEARAAEQAAWVRRVVPNGPEILDYGCGSGSFLRAYDSKHLHVGLDIDPVQIAAAQRADPSGYYLALPSRPLFQNPPALQKTRVGVITCWHTLEHVPHPIPLLADLRTSYATATTLLVLEVPILEHGFTDDLCGFLSHQHTTHFSERSLRNVLKRAGWQPILVEQQAYNGCRIVAQPTAPINTQIEGERHDFASAHCYLGKHRKAVEAVDRRLRFGTTRGLDERLPYVLWGAGMHTEMLYQETSLRAHMPTLIVDSDPAKHLTTWRGIRIVPPWFDKWWHRDEWQKVKLVISSYGSQREIKAQALALGVPESAIVTLYDNPVVY